MRLLPLVLAAAVCATASAQAAWRLSDSLGEDLGPAPARASAGWLLRVEPREGGAVQTLYRDGTEDSVRLIDRDTAGRLVRLQLLKDGRALWEVTYDPVSGLPLTEVSFDAGEPVETSQLEFSKRLLVRRTVRGPAGLLYTDTLSRWPDGTLRRLERDGVDGALAQAAWRYGSDGSLVSAWLVDQDLAARGEHREWLFQPGLTTDTLADSTKALVTRVTEWLAAGSRETETDEVKRTSVTRRLDVAGRVTEEVQSAGGVVVQTVQRAYDDQGRLVQSTLDGAGPTEVWDYTYQDDRVTGLLSRGGAKVREEVLSSGEKVQVSLFQQGQVFLVETWAGGRRVKVTYYEDGRAVRERSP